MNYRMQQPELPIPMGKIIPTGATFSRKCLWHTCSARLRIEGYGGDVTKVICPVCGEIVLLDAFRCRACGIACADMDTLAAHERTCGEQGRGA